MAEAAPSIGAKPPEGDLTAYIDARRRARGEPASSSSQGNTASSPAEDDIERRNRIVAANLGSNQTPTFGYDPKNAGGIFQVSHVGYDYAEFYFFGLNKAIGRNTKQLIEVRKGADSDIRIAVVHKMIAIIRENVSGDFVWMARRGPMTMSARPGDNAALRISSRARFSPTRACPGESHSTAISSRSCSARSMSDVASASESALPRFASTKWTNALSTLPGTLVCAPAFRASAR